MYLIHIIDQIHQLFNKPEIKSVCLYMKLEGVQIHNLRYQHMPKLNKQVIKQKKGF
jgi:hypothetical protein